MRINNNLQKKFSSNQTETIQTNNEIVEQNIVTDILNNSNTDYTPHYTVPTTKTEEQIGQGRIHENTDYIATELAKRERDIQIIEDIEAKNQVDLIRNAIDPGKGIITNEEVSLTDYNRNDNNEPIQTQLEPGVLNVMEEMVKIMSEQNNSIYDDIPALEDIPKTTPPAILAPNLQDILTNDTQNENFDDLIQIKEEITDVLDTTGDNDIPIIKDEPTTAVTIDSDGETIPYVGDSNGETIPYVGDSDGETIPYVGDSDGETIPYVGDSDTESVVYGTPYKYTSRKDEIYRRRAKKKALKILAKKRAKRLKTAKEINKKTNILVPTDVTITSDDPIEILADPNVSTILPPIDNTDIMLNDDDIDFNVDESRIVWDDDNKDLVPLEFDNNKVIMTDDGDVILLGPDNMQVEEKQVVPLSDNVVMLPPEKEMTDLVSTRNIVLKRKQPSPIAQIKKIKNETDVLVRDVPNAGELVVALPPETEKINEVNIIKHPIFRRLEKNKNQADRITRQLLNRQPINIDLNLPALMSPTSLPALMPPSSLRPPASVDISTIRRLPWIDFTTILDNIDLHQREQVIYDILQNNLPSSGDDIYYIYQDPETNVFSIRTDQSAEEIQDFIESILIMDA